LSDFNEPAIEYYKKKLGARERMETGGAKVLLSLPSLPAPTQPSLVLLCNFSFAFLSCSREIARSDSDGGNEGERETQRGGWGGGRGGREGE